MMQPIRAQSRELQASRPRWGGSEVRGMGKGKLADSRDHGRHRLGSDKADDAASQRLQIKNTRDTQGHEGERKRFAEEMLLTEKVDRFQLCWSEKRNC